MNFKDFRTTLTEAEIEVDQKPLLAMAEQLLVEDCLEAGTKDI